MSIEREVRAIKYTNMSKNLICISLQGETRVGLRDSLRKPSRKLYFRWSLLNK